MSSVPGLPSSIGLQRTYPVTYRSSTVTEKALQQRILDVAAALHWLSYHTFDARRSQPGFPDLVLVRPPRLIFAECKSERGRLTAVQERWLSLLRGTGAEVYVWRPPDLPDVIQCLR